MESIHVHQRLRPLRYALVIDRDDPVGLAKAIGINSALWGGRYNPIVPLGAVEETRDLFKEFDPDYVVNLSSGELPASIAERFENRVLSESTLTSEDHPGQPKRFTAGFNILPILNYIWEREIRFSPKEEGRAALVTTKLEDWALYVAVMFGSLNNLPKNDFDFADRFVGQLRARHVEFSPTNISSVMDVFTPLDLTGNGLRTIGGGASVSSHLAFIGDHQNVEDLAAYWNLRATDKEMWFVPVASYKENELAVKMLIDAGQYPLNEQMTNRADLQRAPSISEEQFNTVCDWVASLGYSLPRRGWVPRYGMEIDWYVGDVHVADVQAQSGEEIAFLDEERLTPVKLIAPKFFDDDVVYPARFRWAVEVSASEPFGRNDIMFRLPRTPSVEKLARQSVLGLAEHVRLGREGIVLTQDAIRSSTYLQPVKTTDVFHAIFRDAGLTARTSQPGRYTEEMISKLGRLHFEARVLKIQGVREVLMRLSKGACLTKGNMHAIVMSTEPTASGPNWRPDLYDELYIRDGQSKATPNFSDIFETLLEKRIIRPGREFTCRTCNSTEWYHVSEFDEEYTCRYCFTKQRVPFGNWEWQYKADGVFRLQDSGFGSIAVVVSLWRFGEHHDLRGGRYLTSTLLRAKDDWECEIDYAWLSLERRRGEPELVLGQATTFAPFTGAEVAKVRELSDRLEKRSYLAFTTLASEFSADERTLLRELIDSGHRIIALTRHELDPYRLSRRPAKSQPLYVTGLKQLSENTIALNVMAEPTSLKGHQSAEGENE